MAAITDLEPQLNTTWRTCPEYNSSTLRFWGHEWRVHGTCTGLSQHAYFNLTQALFRANVGTCPEEATAKSCFFCFHATTLVEVAQAQCHL